GFLISEPGCSRVLRGHLPHKSSVCVCTCSCGTSLRTFGSFCAGITFSQRRNRRRIPASFGSAELREAATRLTHAGFRGASRRGVLTMSTRILTARSLLVGTVALVLSPVLYAPPAFAIYVQTNLVSSVPGLAALTDSDLVNSWGIAHSPTSPWWVADNGTA